MKGTTKIKNLGTIKLDGVSVGDGRIEVHIPIEKIDGQLDAIVDKCIEEYLKNHRGVSEDTLNYDVNIIFLCGAFRNSFKCQSELMLMVIIWPKDAEEEAEFYDEIPVELNLEDSKKLRKLIWDRMGDVIFEM